MFFTFFLLLLRLHGAFCASACIAGILPAPLGILPDTSQGRSRQDIGNNGLEARAPV